MSSVTTHFVEYTVKSGWLNTSVTCFQSCDNIFGICGCQSGAVADFCQAVIFQLSQSERYASVRTRQYCTLLTGC
jgi:hypothetical protein